MPKGMNLHARRRRQRLQSARDSPGGKIIVYPPADSTFVRLPLNNVQLTNNGDYSVVVTDDLGSVTSSNATLTVLINPAIILQPQRSL